MRRLVPIASVVVIVLALGQWTLPSALKDGLAHVGRALEDITADRDATGPPSGRRGAYEAKRGRIVRVVDGDTVRVRLRGGGREVTVRLIGIDTPETKRPGSPIECGGPEATANLERLALISAGRVTLDTDETQDVTDRYGRLLAYVRNGHGVDLAAAQLRAGWAGTYVYGNEPFQRHGAYATAQAAARARNTGVWNACDGDFHTR